MLHSLRLLLDNLTKMFQRPIYEKAERHIVSEMFPVVVQLGPQLLWEGIKCNFLLLKLQVIVFSFIFQLLVCIAQGVPAVDIVSCLLVCCILAFDIWMFGSYNFHKVFLESPPGPIYTVIIRLCFNNLKRIIKKKKNKLLTYLNTFNVRIRILISTDSLFLKSSKPLLCSGNLLFNRHFGI